MSTSLPAQYSKIVNRVVNHVSPGTSDDRRDLSKCTSKLLACLYDASALGEDCYLTAVCFIQEVCARVKQSQGQQSGQIADDFKKEIEKQCLRNFLQSLCTSTTLNLEKCRIFSGLLHSGFIVVSAPELASQIMDVIDIQSVKDLAHVQSLIAFLYITSDGLRTPFLPKSFYEGLNLWKSFKKRDTLVELEAIILGESTVPGMCKALASMSGKGGSKPLSGKVQRHPDPEADKALYNFLKGHFKL